MATVLVVGATGNLGVAGVIGAIKSGLKVLAIVRNEASAQKLFQHVGSKEGITTVEADVLSDEGVKSVVERVKAGSLPAFQHVWSSVGNYDPTTPIQDIDLVTFRENMRVNWDSNFLAYRATIPYLIEQGDPNSSWTLITGGAGDLGIGGATAIGQAGLFGLAAVAARENANNNIRFNELYLSHLRVDFDSVYEEKGPQGRTKSSDFARVYEGILADKKIEGCRVTVLRLEDMEDLKYEVKIPDLNEIRTIHLPA